MKESRKIYFHGGSGAKIWMMNGQVYKRGKNALAQHDWYKAALKTPIHDRIIIPEVKMHDDQTLILPFYSGKLAASERSENAVEILMSQTSMWSKCPANKNSDVFSYRKRCLESIYLVDHRIRGDVVKLINELNVPPSFNHGDLTLENCIWDGERLVLIDPLYSDDLFQSYEIDAAKIHQSCNTNYHKNISASFRSNLQIVSSDFIDKYKFNINTLVSLFVRMIKYKNSIDAVEVNNEIKIIINRSINENNN